MRTGRQSCLGQVAVQSSVTETSLAIKVSLPKDHGEGVADFVYPLKKNGSFLLHGRPKPYRGVFFLFLPYMRLWSNVWDMTYRLRQHTAYWRVMVGERFNQIPSIRKVIRLFKKTSKKTTGDYGYRLFEKS